MSVTKIILPILGLVVCAQALHAEPVAESIEQQETLLDATSGIGSPMEIHAFMGQGFMQTTENNYLPRSKRGTTEFSDAGININKQITTNLRAGAQLFARDFGRTGDYEAKFDWFSLDYRWRDWLGIRAGRIKIPYGLYNETQDVDMARDSVFLPQSVYPSDQRDYLLAQTGFDLYGYADLSSAGSLSYRIYRGTLQIDPVSVVGLPFQVSTSDVPYVRGARFIWDTPIKGLHLAATYQTLELDSDLYIPAIPPIIPVAVMVPTTLNVTMRVGSLEYTTRDFQFAAEYAKWEGAFDSSFFLLVPTTVTHERYYGMASYSLKEWLHPGAYYSATYPNVSSRDEPKDFSEDSTVFCRVDLTPNWILKAEWHFINGTAGLNSQMNNGETQNKMDQRWQMFVAKTTIFF